MTPPLSILIVDDHEHMQSTLKDILAEEGYEVITAGSGVEAIERCRQRKFDVIIMDVRMPDLNGVDAFRRIKNLAEGTRVIMMSAYSVEELKREALKEGAIAFLQKPLDVELVLKLIEQTEQLPVLIVMNHQQVRDVLVTMLKQHHYRVYTTSTAEEALELARQIRFNVIMIDTGLAPMNGLELYLALKQITPTSVAIMLAETNRNFLQQAEEAVKQNAYTFLRKPLDLDRLMAILEAVRRQRNSDFIEKPGEPNE